MKQEFRFFSFLEEEELQLLRPYFRCAYVEQGQTLWEEGQDCDYIAFLVSGRIEAKKNTEFAGRQVVVGVYGPGSLIGGLCIMTQAPRIVTAVAIEDSELLLLDPPVLQQLEEQYPHLANKLLRGMMLTVSLRLKAAYERLAAIF